jgi:hypothetical protein
VIKIDAASLRQIWQTAFEVTERAKVFEKLENPAFSKIVILASVPYPNAHQCGD